MDEGYGDLPGLFGGAASGEADAGLAARVGAPSGSASALRSALRNESQVQQVRYGHPTGLTAKISPYHGHWDENFREWMQEFLLNARILKWEDGDKKNMLEYFLKGNARQAFYEIPGLEELSWEDLQVAVEAKMNPTAMKPFFEMELKQREQLPGEDVRVYARALRTLFKSCHPGAGDAVLEEFLVGDFTRGLKDPKVMSEVIKSKPSSLSEAVRIANEVEAQNRLVQLETERRRRRVRAVEVKDRDCEPSPVKMIAPEVMELLNCVKDLRHDLDKQREAANENQRKLQSEIQKLSVRENNKVFEKRGEAPLQDASPMWKDRPRWTSDGEPICFRCGKKGHFKAKCTVSLGSVPRWEPNSNNEKYPVKFTENRRVVRNQWQNNTGRNPSFGDRKYPPVTDSKPPYRVNNVSVGQEKVEPKSFKEIVDAVVKEKVNAQVNVNAVKERNKPPARTISDEMVATLLESHGNAMAKVSEAEAEIAFLKRKVSPEFCNAVNMVRQAAEDEDIEEKLVEDSDEEVEEVLSSGEEYTDYLKCAHCKLIKPEMVSHMICSCEHEEEDSRKRKFNELTDSEPVSEFDSSEDEWPPELAKLPVTVAQQPVGAIVINNGQKAFANWRGHFDMIWPHLPKVRECLTTFILLLFIVVCWCKGAEAAPVRQTAETEKFIAGFLRRGFAQMFSGAVTELWWVWLFCVICYVTGLALFLHCYPYQKLNLKFINFPSLIQYIRIRIGLMISQNDPPISTPPTISPPPSNYQVLAEFGPGNEPRVTFRPSVSAEEPLSYHAVLTPPLQRTVTYRRRRHSSGDTNVENNAPLLANPSRFYCPQSECPSHSLDTSKRQTVTATKFYNISLSGFTMKSLYDRYLTECLLAEPIWQRISAPTRLHRFDPPRVIFHSGRRATVPGYVNVPVTYGTNTKTLKFLICRNLAFDCVLGDSFIEAMNMRVTVTSVVNQVNSFGSAQFAVKLNGYSISALLDTGASVSLIDFDVFENFFPKPSLLTSSSKVIATAVNGNSLDIKGTAKIRVELGNELCVHKFHIMKNCSYSCIIGTDLLAKIGTFSIDLQNKCLEIGGEKFHLGYLPINNVNMVTVTTNVKIPPRTRVILPCVTSMKLSASEFLFEPGEKFLDKYNMNIARALVKPDKNGFLPVQIMNTSSSHRQIPAGKTIGSVEPLENMTINNIDAKPNQKIASNCVKNVDLSQCELEPMQKAKLLSVLGMFSECFSAEGDHVGRTNLVTHKIDTGSHAPLKSRPYRVPMAQRTVIEEQINKMLKLNIIKPSSSPWSSPVVIVMKKDLTPRFCVDFRAVNNVTKKDVYPLPRIDEMFDSLGNCRYFTVMDCCSGYWQIAMDPVDQEKTAFVTHCGLYEFNVMPFGLCNSPSTFQRLMEVVLSGLQWKHCMVYIDDIIVFSSTFDGHVKHLTEVLQRINKAGLKLKLSKCKFAQPSLEFLGHIVTKDGITPDPKKVEAVKNFPIPRDITELRSFLGLCSYYRKFVEGFAKIATPLHSLLKKGNDYAWTPAADSAFNTLRNKLITAPILRFPDFEKPFLLYCDASIRGLGAVLSQKFDEKEHVIAYGSRSLQPAEKNYGISELEGLSCVFFVRLFRPFLYGNFFSLITDHSSLRWLMTTKNPSGRLQRWALVLMEHHFEVKYRAGRKHANADSLSRILLVKDGKIVEYNPVEDFAEILHACGVTTVANVVTNVQSKDFGKKQRQDAKLFIIINFLENNILPEEIDIAKTLTLQKSLYVIKNGLLYHLYPSHNRKVCFEQLVVPRKERSKIMATFHDDALAGGHLSFKKTYYKILCRYFWESMYKDIKTWCMECDGCGSKKPQGHHPRAPMKSIPVGGPFERVATDIIGPLPRTVNGNKYIVCFIDYLTKWTEAKAIPNQTAEEVAKALVSEVIVRHGCPSTLLSDRGTNYMSQVMQEVCNIFDIHFTHTTPYHPQTDGLCEKFNHTLANMLSMYVSSTSHDWDEYIDLVLMAYRISVQSSTGETPFYLLYGRDCKMPVDLACNGAESDENCINSYPTELRENLSEAWEIAKSQITIAQQRQKLQYDKKTKPSKYSVGQKVRLYDPTRKKGLATKFKHPWRRNYEITEIEPPVALLRNIQKPNKPIKRVHFNLLKPDLVPPETLPPQPRKLAHLGDPNLDPSDDEN